MPNALVERFYSQRDGARLAQLKSLDTSTHYPSFGDGTHPYAVTFKWLLDSGFPVDLGFNRLLDDRFQNMGRPQSVLDLMAPASSFLNKLAPSLSFANGVAVTLGQNKDLATEKTIVAGKEIYEVKGDLLQGATWRKIDQGCLTTGNTDRKFDLIVCRPDAPFYSPEKAIFGFQDLSLLMILFKRAWDRLTPENGVFFTQLPLLSKTGAEHEGYRSLMKALEQNVYYLNGSLKISSAYDNPQNRALVVKVIKTQSSPDLPKNLLQSLA